MGFTTELVVEQIGDLDWRLVEPLRYEGHSDTFEVPTGSETDFASVPGIFQWLVPRSGRYTKPAVLHDFLCRHGDERGCDLADADGIFRRAMAELGVAFLRRWIMWGAVRWRSLFKTRFAAGPGDLPQLLLVSVAPGIFVVAGGLVVFALLLVWYLAELVVAGLVALLRALVPPMRVRTKPTVRPKVRWSA